MTRPSSPKQPEDKLEDRIGEVLSRISEGYDSPEHMQAALNTIKGEQDD